MNNFSPFNSEPIRKLKLFKIGKLRVPFTFVAIILAAIVIFMLSTFSINDVDAVFVRDGEFQLGIVSSSNVMFEGDNLNVTLFLVNSTKQNKLISFKGSCQATFSIINAETKQTVWPNSPENTPCDNSGFEEFIMSPAQQKNYYFSVNNKPGQAPILPVGKYEITGVIDGFGTTETRTLEVLKRPITTVGEGQLCQGLTGKTCNSGLECKYEGGFPSGAGMCMQADDDFKPVNECVTSANNCFKDISDNANSESIKKFATMKRIQVDATGEFKPNEAIKRSEFYKLILDISEVKVTLKTDQEFIERDEAIAILYRIFVENKVPETLEVNPFVDCEESDYQPYIALAYKLGVLNLNEERKVYPNYFLNRGDAISYLDKFESIKE